MTARLHWRDSDGFTLVELLVTLAVIGVLAALLLPALSRAKGKARTAACASNLRQVGLALHGFAHDHDGRFPQLVSTNAGGALELSRFPEPWWGQFVRSPAPFAALARDLGNPRVLGCPAESRGPADFASLKTAEVGYLTTIGPRLGDTLSLLAVDRNLDPVRTRRLTNGPFAGQLAVVWTPQRHGERGNSLWGDGHVELRRNLQLPSMDASGNGSGSGPGGEPTDGGGGAGASGGRGNIGSGRDGGNRKGGSGGGGGDGSPAAGDPGPMPPSSPLAPRPLLVQTAGPTPGSSVQSPALGTGRLQPAPSAIGATTGYGGDTNYEREARERRDRWLQRGLLWLLFACMLLGLVAVLSHAWQRFRAVV